MNGDFLHRLLQHDKTAIKDVYTSSFPQIKQFILKNNGSKADAEDIFQDALLVLYKNARRPDFVLHVQPNSYLYAVARNIWFKQLRQKKKMRVTNQADYVLSQEEVLDDQEMLFLRQRLYRKKLKKLGADCQQVLSLFYNGITMKSIAEEMGYSSPGYARKKKFSCKQKLLNFIRQDPLFKELFDHE